MIVKVNNKEININDKEIDKLVDALGISVDEAIQTILEDNGYEVNEEVERLTKQAKDNKITATIHGAQKVRNKREVVRKEDPDKENLIEWIANFLRENVSVDNLEITNKGKLIEFGYLGNKYKLDLVKRRPTKC